jgi:hypothetical protein
MSLPPDEAESQLPTGSILLDLTLTRAQNVHALLRELRKEASADTRLVIDHPAFPSAYHGDNSIDCRGLVCELDAAEWDLVRDSPLRVFSRKFAYDHYVAGLPGAGYFARTRRLVARPRCRPGFAGATAISVIIPVPHVTSSVLLLAEYFRTFTRRIEVILVVPNDAPFAATVILDRLQYYSTTDLVYRTVTQVRPGRLGALADGAEAALGDVVLALDADPRLSAAASRQLVEMIFSGSAEFSIGNRFAYEPPADESAHPIMAKMLELGMGIPIADPLCPAWAVSRHNAIRQLRMALQWADADSNGNCSLLLAADRLCLKTLSVAVRARAQLEPDELMRYLPRVQVLLRGALRALKEVRFAPPQYAVVNGVVADER